MVTRENGADLVIRSTPNARAPVTCVRERTHPPHFAIDQKEGLR
jgi:hypothetical protein